ncbi:MAG: hypothetical protein JOZ87_38790 [Chloroflexi bacterium]|nr:hypothetical protein [Chloroflexota bacterium]
MTTRAEPATALDATAADPVLQRRCVLIVHGVGEQRKSDTLLYIGSPLVNWVMRWARLFYNRPAASVGRVELSFVPFDVGAGDTPPFAVLDLPDQRWYFAEAWWAGSSFHPDFGTMLYWSFVHLFDILAQMLRNTAERAWYLIHPRDPDTSSQPARFWQLVDLINCVVLGTGYAVGVVVGYALLIPLMLVAQVPIEALQKFVLVKLLQPIMTADAGEFRIFIDDELQAANIRRRVADAAQALMQHAECDELIIVAHSEGCVVSLGMLTDPIFVDVARRTRKLLTFGAGLNKTWLIKPTLDRLFAPLTGDTLWTDFWASYDPVPAGPLDPTRRKLANGAACQMTDVYQPSGDALAQVGPGQPPINEQVTNGMNVMTDHGGYFTNEEQVVIRLAAEISAERHTDSAFWPANDVLREGIRARRQRVSALALWRDVIFVAWALTSLGPWLLGWLASVNPWGPLSAVSPSSLGPAGVVVEALKFLQTGLPDLLAPISGIAGVLLGLPALLGIAVLVGVVAWAIYSLVDWQWWQRWDAAARGAFLQASVESSQAQRRAVQAGPDGVTVQGSSRTA